MRPGEVEEETFGLMPTSVRFRAGHRIRIAIGGADAETFARVPAVGAPVWTVERGGLRAKKTRGGETQRWPP